MTVAMLRFFGKEPSQAFSLVLMRAQLIWGRFGGVVVVCWGRWVLTDKECKAARAGDKPVKLFDAHGLHLLVSTTGHKSWRLKYRIAGKEKQVSLGTYPAIRLAQARELCHEARGALRDGRDPINIFGKRSKPAIKSDVATTFEAVARNWVKMHEHLWKPRHTTDVVNSMERDLFVPLGAKQISAIEMRDVRELLQNIQSRGAVETAHRLLQRISSIFTYAIAEELATKNPALGVRSSLKKFRNRKYPALLKTQHAQAFLRDFEALPAYPSTKLASRLLALTAARPGVLRMAEIREFEGLDGKEPVWRVPAEKMKLELAESEEEAYEFVYPLSQQAVEAVKAAIAFAGRCTYLFPSASNGKKPISDNALNQAYRRVVGWEGKHVPHGWRASFSTIMNERASDADRPADRALIDLSLAHVQEGVEPLYNRHAYLAQRRRIAQEWADLLCVNLSSVEALVATRRTT